MEYVLFHCPVAKGCAAGFFFDFLFSIYLLPICSVENLRKMSLRGPKGRGNLLRDRQTSNLGELGRAEKAIIAFEIASLRSQ